MSAVRADVEWGGGMRSSAEGGSILMSATVKGAILGLLVGALLLGSLLVTAEEVRAQASGPQWRPFVYGPTRAEPGAVFTYRVTAANVGKVETDGTATLDIALPTGVTAVSVASGISEGNPPIAWTCDDPTGASAVHCEGSLPFPVLPNQQHPEDLIVTVAVDAAASGQEIARFELSDGGTVAPSGVEHSLNVSATPDFGIADLDGGVFDRFGEAFTQAGGHPDSASLTFDLKRAFHPGGLPLGGGQSRFLLHADGGPLRNTRADLPPGLVGNPTAMPRCSRRLAIPSSRQGTGFDPNTSCPSNTVVGSAAITQIGQSGVLGVRLAPVFNLEPAPGVPAQFGFNFSEQTVILDAQVRSDGDYGVSITSRNASSVVPVVGASVTLWGVPADPSHDNQRCIQHLDLGTTAAPVPSCDLDLATKVNAPWNAPSPAVVEPKAFLTNPSACTPPGAGLETRLRVESWDASSPADDASFVSHLSPGIPAPPSERGAPQGPDGCEHVPFDPRFKASADTANADAPSSLTVDLAFPQDGLLNPAGLAQGHLKRTKVTLPEGWSVSPSSADGLAGCSDAQSSVGTLLAAQCPEASKIGTVEATTPLLEERLEGGVYVGTQESDDPMSGRMFRMFIALDNEERGIRVKLPGQVRIDPGTGRIEVTFDNNPQVPVEQISLKLKTGPRAPLATPAQCGTRPVVAEFTSWSGAAVTRTSDLTIHCPGVQGFGPAFSAYPAGAMAGRFSPFLVRLDRADGQEFIDGVEIELPKGSLAKLKGVPVCDNARAAAGTCDAGSRVGSATVGAGPGTNPFYLSDQPVYLAGPYKGAPYSLSVVTHAKAGPFDLGKIVVRQALRVDRTDAHVTVESDPLPTIVKGVPVRLRSVSVDIDRPNFALSPTSCVAKDVRAQFHSQQGSSAVRTSRFAVHDCALLGFRPRLALSLTGRRQVRTGKHPGVRAQVKQTGIGEAAIAKARVELPKSLALDPDNAQALCEFDQGSKDDLENHCPKGSIVGRARAVTPLLDEPLAGNVYFVKNVRRSASGNLIRTLPMIVVALRGKIAINLRGTSSTTRDGRLVNTFADVPDAPITRFQLNIKGGRNGILAVTRTRSSRINLCARPNGHLATVGLDGHNQKRADFRTRVKTPCGKRR